MAAGQAGRSRISLSDCKALVQERYKAAMVSAAALADY